MTNDRPRTARRLAAAALVAGLVAAGGAGVYAQTGGFVWDPSSLPETKGTIRQYTLTPRGDVDGLILQDGTEVKLPPHLTGQVVYAIRPGDAVTIRGMKARALPLVDAASIRNDASGVTIVDAGPPGRGGDETTLTAKVTMPLHGKRGEVNGALLDTGASLRLPPHEAVRWNAFLQPGQSVSLRGAVSTTALGTVIDVRAIGPAPDRLTEIDAPPPGRRGKEGRQAFAPPPPPPPGGPADALPPPPPPGGPANAPPPPPR
ncbi:hypothetical protein [Methylobacterium sp. JK268]